MQKKHSRNMFDLELWLWTDLGETCALHIGMLCWTFVQNLLIIFQPFKRYIGGKETARMCLTVNCDLEQTLLKNAPCTSAHYPEHLCQVFFLNLLSCSRDIEDTKAWQTDSRPDRWTDNNAKNNMAPHFMLGGMTLIVTDDDLYPCTLLDTRNTKYKDQ